MKVNFFNLSPEEKVAYLRDLAELMGVLPDWEVLASVRPQMEPYFLPVAQRIASRLKAHPFTQEVSDVTQALANIAHVYFSPPHLDAQYMERRASAGKAYLEAGFSMASLVGGIYGLWVDEWTRVFEELFSHDPPLLARLNRAMAKVALYNLALVAQQFTHESEVLAKEMEERLLNKFLKATGISRELYQQMAKTAEGE